VRRKDESNDAGEALVSKRSRGGLEEWRFVLRSKSNVEFAGRDVIEDAGDARNLVGGALREGRGASDRVITTGEVGEELGRGARP